ncbi:class I SAM-dependent methyltransferase [Streptomyces sp. NPDC056656]|uniref:class I SAM-dependent methyltransferase n=1 Tax=Streptomyces sp. NPDC056656 TaxID=3345895 RepID=UPI00369775D4
MSSISVSSYVFADTGSEEESRLRLLAGLLDPAHRAAIETAGIRAGHSCLEVGSGAGTIAEWMAGRVGPDGRVVAADINLSFLGGLSRHTNTTVRRLDVLTDPLPQAAFDVITARALLHHLPGRDLVIARLAAALKPGGALVLVEPDASVSIANSEAVHRRFWSAWCEWGRSADVDFTLGGKLPTSLRAAGLTVTDVRMEVPYYTGGSPWADLYLRTLRAAEPRLGTSIDPDLVSEFEAASADPDSWFTSLGWISVVARQELGAHGALSAIPRQRERRPGPRT